MDRRTFQHLVDRAVRRLPGKFSAELRNILIEIEDEPPQEILDDMGVQDRALYGLYEGVPLTEREWNFGNALPDRIVIYQRPIERDARSGEEAEEIVRDTVLHEIGHYFGYGDDELYAMEDEIALRRRKGR